MTFPTLQRWTQTAADLLIPPLCAGCQCRLESGWLCAKCTRLTRRVKPPFCQCCSHPFDGAIDTEFQCPNCQDRPMHFTCAVASRHAQGLVRNLIHDFKYNHREHLRRPLAGWLADTLDDSRMTATPIDALIPVPLHATRQRERGYNQARLLAEILAAEFHFPLLHTLKRVRRTQTQTSFDRAERMENLHDAFHVSQNTAVQNKHLVLVDDVLTTGSTLNECARVLLASGAASVRAICVARG
ncbi:MAG: ComF family protein [Chthoniobacterales bacterium]